MNDVSREICLVLCKSYLSYFKFEVITDDRNIELK